MFNIVTDLMNALPGNSSVNTVQHATIKEAVFSVDPTYVPIDCLDSDHVMCVYCKSMSSPPLYKSNKLRSRAVKKKRVETGSNTSTVTLRVVGGDEKGSLKSQTVKYGLETKGPQIQEGLHWRGPVVYTKDRPVLSSERTLHKNRTVIVKQ
jgi:hypothetical protein